jgi:hypothetical protein
MFCVRSPPIRGITMMWPIAPMRRERVMNDAGAIVGMMSEGDLVRWHEGYSGR